MEVSPALSDAVRPTCRFLLALTDDRREICYPKPGLSVGDLSLCMVSLGAGARDEMHVLEAEGAMVKGRTVSQASARFTLQPCLPTQGLAVNLTPPVTFRLKTGPGPLFISGQHLVAVESTSAAVAMVTANGASVPPTENAKELARIAESLKTWKRLHMIHGILPAVAQVALSSDPKKLCTGLADSSRAVEPVASAVPDSARRPEANVLCQRPYACNATLTTDTGPKRVPQGFSVAKPVAPTLQKGTLVLPPTKKKLKELIKKANVTVDEIKEVVQGQLIRGDKIPIQLLKFKSFLRTHYRYEAEDYASLVQLWQWRLSLYKTYG